ncbi:hypothetical protein KP79_PYT02015 [Mizuhopecten yessoensis]|uniref:Uncharacterized protein n=1 Tax=Mizuhopecten yessoensis TaxID=6573 RepID=A0A210Q1X7_MIZYE|nr:hypothetical protein KP79_PYT02015 [Mizuhopecten yessoensis]
MNEIHENKLEVVTGDVVRIASDYACVIDRHVSDEQNLKLMRNDLNLMKETNDQVFHQYQKVSRDAKAQLQYISYMLPPCRLHDSDITSSTGSSIKGDNQTYRRYENFHDFYKLRLPHDEHRRLFERISKTKVDEYLDGHKETKHQL